MVLDCAIEPFGGNHLPEDVDDGHVEILPAHGDRPLAPRTLIEERSDEELRLFLDDAVDALFTPNRVARHDQIFCDYFYLLSEAKVPERGEGEPPLLLPHRPRLVDDPAHVAVRAPDVLVVVFGRTGAQVVSREEGFDLGMIINCVGACLELDAKQIADPM